MNIHRKKGRCKERIRRGENKENQEDKEMKKWKKGGEEGVTEEGTQVKEELRRKECCTKKSRYMK